MAIELEMREIGREKNKRREVKKEKERWRKTNE